MERTKIVAVTDLEHSSPRISNLLYYLDKDKYDLYLIGADYSNNVKKDDLPKGFETKLKISSFKRKINVFSFLKRNFEQSNKIGDDEKKSSIYLFFRRIIIDLLLNINFPDQYRFTTKKYLKLYANLNLKGKVILISSSPYPTSHIAAYKIKSKYKSNIKWIADYRDLWSLNSNYHFNKLRLFFEKKYEKKIISKADKVVTVSEKWANIQGKFLNRHVDVIPNGYSIQNFKSLNKIKFKSSLLNKKKTNILYVGAIYFNAQDVLLFFESIKEINSNEFEVHFMGKFSPELEFLIKKNKLENNIKQIGFFTRKESQQLQQLYDYLLFFDLKQDDGWILLKFYEYIGANKPILCIGGEEITAHKEILKSLGRGTVLSNANEILSYFNSIQKVSYQKINPNESEKYSYEIQSLKMEQLIENIIKIDVA